MKRPETFDALRDEILAEREDVRQARSHSALKRALAMALVDVRHRAGLTQSELANRAGWEKAFVSRLEGASGGLPTLDTMMRYAEVCGADLALQVGGDAGTTVPLERPAAEPEMQEAVEAKEAFTNMLEALEQQLHADKA